MEAAKRTCLVVMGFGKKTDFETGRTLDLDKSYRNIIKPAVEAAGFQCIRADEIVHAGLIDVPMYEHLLNAEVVIADLSTSNKNALYELGLRHALRPYTTIVIAEDGTRSPFYNFPVLQYKHLGEDIGFDEVMRFSKVLSEAILSGVAKPVSERVDSPVYLFLKGLVAPRQEQVPSKAVSDEQADASKASCSIEPLLDATHSTLMEQVDRAVERADFASATALLRAVHSYVARKNVPVPADLVQRLAFVTFKSELPTETDALNEAVRLLSELAPDTSNDTQTLLLWGRIHARAWELTKDPTRLDIAIYATKRGFYLRNDHDSGINHAYLLNVRAAETQRAADAVADFVLARRVRTEVLDICARALQSHERSAAAEATPEGQRQYVEIRYRLLAATAEAMVGLERPEAQSSIDAALAAAPAQWMANETQHRIEQLQWLLSHSPLTHLQVA